jgi:alkylation response protein AidB-like acyl-CoA dehydrogenase
MPADVSLTQALAILPAHANAADAEAAWPEESWQALADSGVLRWCIPAAYGGGGLEGVELLEGY